LRILPLDAAALDGSAEGSDANRDFCEVGVQLPLATAIVVAGIVVSVAVVIFVVVAVGRHFYRRNRVEEIGDFGWRCPVDNGT
jgi:multisubunit Na+/H+ antiporter MnhC subunit